MAPYDAAFTAGIFNDILDHLMGNRMGKQDDEIRSSDAVSQSTAGFAENLSPVSVLLTQLAVSSLHTFISAYNHYTHKILLFDICMH